MRSGGKVKFGIGEQKLYEKLRRHLAKRRLALANARDYCQAAVLLLLLPGTWGPELLFEVRARDLVWQPGEICFPGGRIEADDATPAHTALRETCEEVGLAPRDIKLLGALDYTVNPIGVALYPYVGYVTQAVPLTPNREEVAELFTVPVAWFMAQRPRRARMEVATRPMPGFPLELAGAAYPAEWRRRASYPVLFYQYRQYVIWGLTARLVDGFVSLCRQLGYTQEDPLR